MNNKIIVFCPNPHSLYTTSICELLLRAGVNIEYIIVKNFTVKRFIQEFKRDGKRLIFKIWRKLILRENAYDIISDKNIIAFRSKENILPKTVFQLDIKVKKVNDFNSFEIEQLLNRIKPRLAVFTGGGLIKENILNASGDGVINCHIGVLPEYRGMDVPEWAILEGHVDKIGFTVHFMDKGVDTGDILNIFKVNIIQGESLRQLRERIEPLMAQKLVSTVIDYLNQDIDRKKQEQYEGKQYFVMHKKLYEIANSKAKHLK